MVGLQEPYISPKVGAAIERVQEEITGKEEFIAPGLAIVALVTGFRLTPELLARTSPAVMVTPSSRFE